MFGQLEILFGETTEQWGLWRSCCGHPARRRQATNRNVGCLHALVKADGHQSHE